VTVRNLLLLLLLLLPPPSSVALNGVPLHRAPGTPGGGRTPR